MTLGQNVKATRGDMSLLIANVAEIKSDSDLLLKRCTALEKLRLLGDTLRLFGTNRSLICRLRSFGFKLAGMHSRHRAPIVSLIPSEIGTGQVEPLETPSGASRTYRVEGWR
jgi:hypothetical protein